MQHRVDIRDEKNQTDHVFVFMVAYICHNVCNIYLHAKFHILIAAMTCEGPGDVVHRWNDKYEEQTISRCLEKPDTKETTFRSLFTDLPAWFYLQLVLCAVGPITDATFLTIFFCLRRVQSPSERFTRTKEHRIQGFRDTWKCFENVGAISSRSRLKSHR